MIDSHLTVTRADPWTEFLALCEGDRPTISAQQVAAWPQNALENFVSDGLLRETEPDSAVDCTGCPEVGYCDVVIVAHPDTGAPLAYLRCPECGPYEIPLASLRRWSLDVTVLAQLVARGLSARGTVNELVAGRLWQLGKVYCGGRPTTLFLGRALHRRDAAEFLAPVTHFASAMLLVPKRKPTIAFPHPVLSLDLFASWAGETLAFDPEFATGQIAPLPADAKPRRRRKSPPRATVTERLKAELIDHLRACRDHVQAALEFGREPALLPFPTQAQLAQRCGTSAATVNRCLKQDRELRILCDESRDVLRLIGHLER